MTKLLVLGLLDGAMSGYDLQQKLGGADAEQWGGVLPGSIYHALKKLEGGCIALAGKWSRRATGRRRSTGLPGGTEHLHPDRRRLRASSALYPTLYSASPTAGRQAASGGGAASPGGAAAAGWRRIRRPGQGRAGNEGQEVPPWPHHH